MSKSASHQPRPRRVRLRARAIVAALLRVRETLRPQPRCHVLILGHMRSGSSLLHHLLLQHPQVAGAGERNATYQSARDLERLVVDAYLGQRRFLHRASFFADQINHSRFLQHPALLLRPDVRPIFLLRRPGTSIASMVEVLVRYYGWHAREAIAYYRARVTALERLGEALPPAKALFVRYEALTTDTDRVLAQLQRHLELPPPALTARYPIQRFTGNAGDPSATLRSGRVQAPRAESKPIEDPIRNQLEARYDRCATALAKHIPPG